MLKERMNVGNLRALAAGTLASAPFAFLAYQASVYQTGEFLKLEPDAAAIEYLVAATTLLKPLLVFVLTYLIFTSVVTTMRPTPVRVVWLRRFQSERGSFAVSRVIDRLQRHGIAPLTLQDRDVQLSFEQRRARIGPVFLMLFWPIALIVSLLMMDINAQSDEIFSQLRPEDDASFSQMMSIGVGAMAVSLIEALAVVLAGLLLVVAWALGPVGRVLRQKRDDTRKLARLVRRLRTHRVRRVGSSVFRVPDNRWQEAVQSILTVVDVAIIDVSEVSNSIVWEIDEAKRILGDGRIVWIVRDGVAHDNAVRYPQRRNQGGRRFARSLRTVVVEATRST